jgi:hypothetical protein
MIDAALKHVRDQLNQFLKRSFGLNEDVVVLSNIIDQDGSVAASVNDKLVVFLVNIERDRTPANGTSAGLPAGRTATGVVPIHLNLYVMISGNFRDYVESLKFLSNTVSFFQRYPVLDPHNTPDLDRRIDRLVMEIENLSIHDLSTLWGVLSGRYLPSVFYKIRMVTFDSDTVLSQVSRVEAAEQSVST